MDEANQHFNKFLKTKRVREIPLNVYFIFIIEIAPYSLKNENQNS